ncbi:hypothetical protein GGR54DRAFT_643510 [Hypoxylon sp. NC1633]|nr:hypothetical protein GGR54DRAFT_643510 [Hypoxylon sp. NC1633]
MLQIEAQYPSYHDTAKLSSKQPGHQHALPPLEVLGEIFQQRGADSYNTTRVDDEASGSKKGQRKDRKPDDSSDFIDMTPRNFLHGYPQLAALIAVNEQSRIFRRFRYIHMRLLLDMQDQLRVCEDDLALLDLSSDTASRSSRQASGDDSRKCRELLQKMEPLIDKYYTHIKHASRLCLLESPLETDTNNLRAYFKERTPVVDDEQYYRYKYDLLTLESREDKSAVDAGLTKLLCNKPCQLLRAIFRDKEESRRHLGTFVVLSSRKITIAKAIILGIALIILLLSPVCPLYYLSQGEVTGGTMAIIMFVQLGFTCLFVVSLNCLARPKGHELFACSVAYMSFLVVFMSQTIQPP